jgi:hypothetical protein
VVVEVELGFHLPLEAVVVVELAVVVLVELQMEVVERQEQQTLELVVVELVAMIQIQELMILVDQVVRVSLLQEHLQLQEFTLQHAVHVHQLHLLMVQLKLQK